MRTSVKVFWRLVALGTGSLVLVLLLANFGIFGEMPSVDDLQNPTASLASEVYAADGTLMGKFYKVDRSNVSYQNISKNVVNALVATEDERFYTHSGVDPKGVLRAVAFLGSKGGGSTITQQLALNMFDERERNPIMRVLQKMKEWIIAIKLERNFTKEEIIALYLNVVPFSDNVYGIRNASLTFFQKEPDLLSIDEAAVLVGMVNGPTLFNPRRNPKSALDRRNHVINKMAENKYISEAEATKLKIMPINLNYKKLDENAGLAPYFRDVVREELKQWCKNHEKPNGDNYNIYRDGLKIYTTINPRMQLYAEEAVAKHMAFLQPILNSQSNVKSGSVWKNRNNVLEAAMKNSDRWNHLKEDGATDEEIKASFYQKTPMKVFAWNSKRQKDTIMTPIDSIRYHKQMLQTGFMAMDPNTGEIKAWVGGIDFKTFKYDHANKKTKRQVGSTIKPLLYAQALKDANFTPQTPCENSPQCFPSYNWCSKNASGRGGGMVSMASGLAYSLNNVTAYLIKQVGPSQFADFLKECEIESEIPKVPSICLGTPDISLIEMLRSYTMFPGRGINVEPIFITRIEDKNGNTLETFVPERKEVISEQDAYTMVKMMQGVVDFGTGASLRSMGIPGEMGGKTGTTNDNADAWFIGYTPQLLAGAWVGCDDRFIRFTNDYIGQGAKSALPIWGYFFDKVYKDNTLGIDKSALFLPPANASGEVEYDYQSLIDTQAPPGAEGENIGTGTADEYMEATIDSIGPESSLTEEEELIKAEATKAANPPANPSEKKENKPALLPPASKGAVTEPKKNSKPTQKQENDY